MKSFVWLVTALLCCLPPNRATAGAADANIFYVGLSDDGYLIVDTTGHQDFSESNRALAEKLLVAEVGPWKVVPADDLPSLLKVSTVELLTPQGRVSAHVTEARIAYGASEARLMLVTDKKGTEPEFQGGLTRLGPPLPKSAQLRAMGSINGNDRRVAKSAAAFKSWVDRHLSEQHVQLYRTLKIRPADFSFQEGAFRPQGKWLVWGTYSWAEDRQDNSEKSFTVGAIVDAQGVPVEVLQMPQAGMGDGLFSWEPKFHVDIDADGTEELLAQVSHYEGAEMRLYRWQGRKMRYTVLQGDSA